MSNDSTRLFAQSQRLMPGGVNSPVRAFGSVGGNPFVTDRGEGPLIIDVDGREYVDYVMSWGPLILGHAPALVVSGVSRQIALGASFGTPTRGELELAAMVRERMPCVEKIRFVSSGTEACMTAIRIARGVTKRDLVVKFDGGYHGHSDSFLVRAGSGLATGNLAASAGVPAGVTSCSVSIPYNDMTAVRGLFEQSGSTIAAVIVEPVAANMGVVPPVPGFLELLRELTSKHGAILIFDEVITGFRVAPGGATELFGMKPDLVCLGKILGGGLPIGAVGGTASMMDRLAPIGDIYQAGTLSGNPLSTCAGISTLKGLDDSAIYDQLRQYADDLTGRIAEQFKSSDLPFTINKVESLFTLFFNDQEVTDFASAGRSDMVAYGRFFHALLDAGVFIAPSGFEAWFVSTAHGQEQLDATINAVDSFLNL